MRAKPTIARPPSYEPEGLSRHAFNAHMRRRATVSLASRESQLEGRDFQPRVLLTVLQDGCYLIAGSHVKPELLSSIGYLALERELRLARFGRDS